MWDIDYLHGLYLSGTHDDLGIETGLGRNMAKIKGTPVIVTIQATITFDEAELRALDALVGYGFEPFKRVFYDKLGKAYMEQHEAGLKSLFDSIRQEVPSIIGKAEDARDVLRDDAIKKAEQKSPKKDNAIASEDCEMKSLNYHVTSWMTVQEKAMDDKDYTLSNHIEDYIRGISSTDSVTIPLTPQQCDYCMKVMDDTQ